MSEHETTLYAKFLFDDYSVDGLIKAIKQFNSLIIDSNDCVKQAEKFSKERFKKEFLELVEKTMSSNYREITN